MRMDDRLHVPTCLPSIRFHTHRRMGPMMKTSGRWMKDDRAKEAYSQASAIVSADTQCINL